MAFAETIREKETRTEMLAKTELLIKTTEEAKALIVDEDTKLICAKVSELFKLLPDHLVSIGTKMDMGSKKVIKMEKETKKFLIYMHVNNNLCENDVKNMDLGELNKTLKQMSKSFKDQKKKINKADLNFANGYNYYYEF